MNTAEDLDLIWGVDQIAQFLNLSPRQVEHEIKEQRLPVGRLGRRLVASRSALRAYFNKLLNGGKVND